MIEQIILVSVVGGLLTYSLYDSYMYKYNKNYICMKEIEKKKSISREIL